MKGRGHQTRFALAALLVCAAIPLCSCTKEELQRFLDQSGLTENYQFLKWWITTDPEVYFPPVISQGNYEQARPPLAIEYVSARWNELDARVELQVAGSGISQHGALVYWNDKIRNTRPCGEGCVVARLHPEDYRTKDKNAKLKVCEGMRCSQAVVMTIAK